MGIYVDASDIKQHFRAGNSMTNETVEELMEEQEYYVQRRLRLDSLPEFNPTLTSIIRALTIAACIYALIPATSDDVLKADNMQREALRRLREIEDEGVQAIGITRPSNSWESEVINPYEKGFFSPSDFGLS